MESLADKYKIRMHREMDLQMDEWSSKMMGKFKLAMNRVLLSFVNNNQNVNGFAESVASIFMNKNLVNEMPKNNLTNRSMVSKSRWDQEEFPVCDRKATKRPLVTQSTFTDLKSESISKRIKIPILDSTNKEEKAKQVINYERLNRVGMECFQLDCRQLFRNEDLRNDHMWARHHIRAFPCLVKDCGYSFGTEYSLVDHTKKYHPSISDCFKCCEYFSTYADLSIHYLRQHFTQYQCGFTNCTFTSGHGMVCAHYAREHPIRCRHSGCGRVFKHLLACVAHERNLCRFKSI